MWELIMVTETQWQQDSSGYYTLINYVGDNVVRLDWMDNSNNMPIISFQGKADDVRKCIMQGKYWWKNISREHASYIGSELARAELLKDKYVQS